MGMWTLVAGTLISLLFSGGRAMRSIKGPAIFLAQFAGDAPPFNNLKAIAGWAAGLGFKGVQIPSWDRRLFDLGKAAASQTYCDAVKALRTEPGLHVTRRSTSWRGAGARFSTCSTKTGSTPASRSIRARICTTG